MSKYGFHLIALLTVLTCIQDGFDLLVSWYRLENLEHTLTVKVNLEQMLTVKALLSVVGKKLLDEFNVTG